MKIELSQIISPASSRMLTSRSPQMTRNMKDSVLKKVVQKFKSKRKLVRKVHPSIEMRQGRTDGDNHYNLRLKTISRKITPLSEYESFAENGNELLAIIDNYLANQ